MRIIAKTLLIVVINCFAVVAAAGCYRKKRNNEVWISFINCTCRTINIPLVRALYTSGFIS